MDNLNVPSEGTSPDIARRIFLALKGIRYGSVEIIIHDSRVFQIERREKVRLDEEVHHRR